VGRATVQLTVEKGDGSLAFVDRVNGGLSSTGKVSCCQVTTSARELKAPRCFVPVTEHWQQSCVPAMAQWGIEQACASPV
jgi:hypothetical protein